ncbi:MAG: electron transport complex subunit RsxC [Actinobacteria bacterium]|nr:electron transport complex subunit RsxC [Actinomycetota bacterium]
MELKTFTGGIHPDYRKEATAYKATEEIALPEEVVIQMRQHVGAPNEPTVSAGDRVEAGTTIGSTEAFVSAPVHASVSGEVTEISEQISFSGALVNSVTIKVDPDQPDKWTGKKNLEGITPEQIREIAKESGLVGLGGAAFPTHIKLSPPADKPIDIVIINGCECEPFLTCDHRVMLENTEDLIEGLKLMMKAVGAGKGIIGIEANKMDVVEAVESKTASESGVEVMPLEVKYPQGNEKMLIDALTGRRVPPGKLPSEVGVLVQNSGTAVALYKAASTGRPVIDRIITVSGSGIREPKNVRVRIGTRIEHVIEQCGGFVNNPEKVIMGGPMTGFAQKSLSAPTVKGTSGIVVLTGKETGESEERECVGCGKCVDACPMFLMPNSIVKYIKRNQYEKADKYGVKDCFECGCCSYVCPARIHHVGYVRIAKAELAAKK